MLRFLCAKKMYDYFLLTQFLNLLTMDGYSSGKEKSFSESVDRGRRGQLSPSASRS